VFVCFQKRAVERFLPRILRILCLLLLLLRLLLLQRWLLLLFQSLPYLLFQLLLSLYPLLSLGKCSWVSEAGVLLIHLHAIE
jgi:hypothetical protein